ncbi:hypothetical protein BH09BAC6_BH09BAC6_30270 [soil metagenome]
MERKKLIKEHLITCSVIVALVFISAVNISSTRIKKSTKSGTKISKFVLKHTEAENDYSFANEALPIENGKVSEKMTRSLKKHNFHHIQSNILQRKAGKLFPIIEPILKAYGIPEDFKYIPLVESGLSEGTSPKGAKGMWQFMPGTARTYGLRVGHGVDERKDLRKSTVAACKYIRELYDEFNNWTLAAAAYNNGSIKLARAIRKQGQDNYFLMHLNRETGAYVYNLVAMKAIISQPGKYGYKNNFVLKPSEFLAIN